MRINFNPLTASDKNFPNWLGEYRVKWLTEYDFDLTYSNKVVNEYVWSPTGSKNFVFWLQRGGFKVDYWEVDFVPNGELNPVAYGLIFDDACPKFVYEQLKGCD